MIEKMVLGWLGESFTEENGYIGWAPAAGGVVFSILVIPLAMDLSALIAQIYFPIVFLYILFATVMTFHKAQDYSLATARVLKRYNGLTKDEKKYLPSNTREMLVKHGTGHNQVSALINEIVAAREDALMPVINDFNDQIQISIEVFKEQRLRERELL